MQAPDNSPDFSDASSLADALLKQADLLLGMAKANAAARTVIEYASDRKKVALAIATKRAREAGAKSMAEAECMALASVEYGMVLERLMLEHQEAEQSAQLYRAHETKFEALRTATSLQKSIVSAV